MGSSWKLALVFAVLFLTGGLSGSLLTHSLMRRLGPPGHQRTFRSWSDNLTHRLTRVANLTPEQVEKIRPRVEAAVKQMESIQIQSMQQVSDALDAALAEIEPGLNPDQQKALERFRERRRAFLQQAIQRRENQE
jgi:hypothetical protein